MKTVAHYFKSTVLLLLTVGVLSLSGVLQGSAAALSTSSTTMISTSPSGEAADHNGAFLPTISPNGRYVAFDSDAGNLNADADGTYSQVYLKDTLTNTIEVISKSGDGTIGNESSVVADMSQDGRYVLFYSGATNLVPGIEPAFPTGYLYLRDRQLGTTTGIAPIANVSVIVRPSMDNSASVIAYTEPNQTGTSTLYKLDRTTGVTVAVGETTLDGFVSADGSNIVFLTNHQSVANDELYDLAQYNVNDGTMTTLLSQLPLLNCHMSPDNTRLTYTARDASNTPMLKLVNVTTGSELQTINPGMFGTPYALSFSGNNQYVSYMTHSPAQTSSIGDLVVENIATQEKLTLATNVHRFTVAILNQDGTKLAYTYATESTGRQAYIATLSEDTAPPTIGSPSINPQLMLFTHSATVSATTSDSDSGVARGEYYIDTDPGVGHGVSLAYDNGKISGTATISGLTSGIHRLYLRSVDNAGNWSSPVSVQFIYVNFN